MRHIIFSLISSSAPVLYLSHPPILLSPLSPPQVFTFGLTALEQFSERLPEWPLFCQQLLLIPAVRDSATPSLLASLERGASGTSPLASASAPDASLVAAVVDAAAAGAGGRGGGKGGETGGKGVDGEEREGGAVHGRGKDGKKGEVKGEAVEVGFFHVFLSDSVLR